MWSNLTWSNFGKMDKLNKQECFCLTVGYAKYRISSDNWRTIRAVEDLWL